MRLPIQLTVNGQTHALAVEPRWLLLDLLREDLGLTGARRGCESSYCGCCTVLLDGQPVHACSVLAVAVGGREVTTIEGLAAAGTLHPLQEAFINGGAIQCGYCTPGFILTAASLLQHPDPGEAEIRAWLLGNLCRCTGYQKIVAAIRGAAAGTAAG